MAPVFRNDREQPFKPVFSEEKRNTIASLYANQQSTRGGGLAKAVKRRLHEGSIWLYSGTSLNLDIGIPAPRTAYIINIFTKSAEATLFENLALILVILTMSFPSSFQSRTQ